MMQSQAVDRTHSTKFTKTKFPERSDQKRSCRRVTTPNGQSFLE